LEIQSLRELLRQWRAGEKKTPDHLPFLTLPIEESPLIEGWTHILSGKAKAGKTELMLQVALTWPDRTVIWFSEEAEGVWLVRFEKGLDRVLDALPGDIHIITELKNDTPTQMLQKMEQLEKLVDVVVIDTVKLLRVENENDAAAVTRALYPITGWAEKAKAVLILLHHNRKADGMHGDELAGSHAWGGNIDMVMSIKRDVGKGKKDTVRVVETVGRVMAPKPFKYEWDEKERVITLLGNVDDVGLDKVKERVMEVVEAGDRERGLMTAEIRNALTNPQPSLQQVRKALMELAEEGGIVKVGDGGKGNVVMWRVKDD